jgi:hypothetical protein
VGPHPIYPVGTISLPVMFRTEENFRTENIQFDVAEVNLPFNAIMGTDSWSLPIMGTWSSRCHPLQECSPCRETGLLLSWWLRGYMHWLRASPQLPAQGVRALILTR